MHVLDRLHYIYSWDANKSLMSTEQMGLLSSYSVTVYTFVKIEGHRTKNAEVITAK